MIDIGIILAVADRGSGQEAGHIEDWVEFNIDWRQNRKKSGRKPKAAGSYFFGRYV